MSSRPRLVAIVNVTEDSFSDGGRYLEPAAALEHARRLAREGADVIELGPASSNPDAAPVPAAIQIERLAPVVAELAREGRSLSVDATLPEVLEWAIAARVDLLNDVRGFPDARLYDRLADSEARLVVVHSLFAQERATRDEASPTQVLDSIERFFDRRLAELVRAGVAEQRLIVDPGMGFFLGRDPRASLAVLQRIPQLRARFGRPVFISVSRKSFLRKLTGRDTSQVGAATLAAELHAAREGAEWLRTHDVAALADALAIDAALRPSFGLGSGSGSGSADGRSGDSS